MSTERVTDKEGSAPPFDPAVHLPQLDGLRGVAILLVLVFHFHQFLTYKSAFAQFYLPYALWGWVGVDLFFVLSGFLITGILWRYKSRPRYFITFYGRRFLRIFPLYYLFLVILLIATPLFLGASRLHPFSDLWYWLHAGNIAIAFYGWPQRHLSHLWSLAMEEQYYLFWPFVIRFGNRAFISAIGIGFVLLGMAIRFDWDASGSPIRVLYTFPLARLDGFIFGALIAIWREELGTLIRGAYRSKFLLLVVLAIPVCLGVFNPFALMWKQWQPLGMTLNFTLISLYFAALLLVVLEAKPDSRLYRLFSIEPLCQLGKYSYAIYMIHVPLDTLMRGLHLHPIFLSAQYRIPAMIPYVLVMTAVVYGLSRLSWWLFESRFLALKRYFQY